MKPLISILFFVHSVFAFSQTSEIVKILNRELEKEIFAQKGDSENYYGEKFEVIKYFEIENNVLSLEIKKKKLYETGFYTEKQEVDLRKIQTITKDINIIFETEPDSVTITYTEENGEKNTKTTDMFFLHLSYEKYNEYIADEIITAFQEVGYKIKKGVWYD